MATCSSSAPAPAQGSSRPAQHSTSSGASAAAEDGASRGSAHRTSSNVSPPTASAPRIRVLDLLLLGLRSSGLLLHLRSRLYGWGGFSGLLLHLRSRLYGCGGFSGLLLTTRSSDHG